MEGCACRLEEGYSLSSVIPSPHPDRSLHASCRSRREELAPFQAAEAVDVRRKSDAFGERVDAYRAFFLRKAPFAVPAGEELCLEHVRAGAGSSAAAAKAA